MMKEINIYELIEKYLNGTASSDEKYSLEIMMEEDSSVTEELEKHRQMRELVLEGSLLEVKDSLQQIHDTHTANYYNKGLLQGGIAFGIVVLAFLGWRLFNHSNNNEPVIQNQPGNKNTIIAADTAESSINDEPAVEIIQKVKPDEKDNIKEKILPSTESTVKPIHVNISVEATVANKDEEDFKIKKGKIEVIDSEQEVKLEEMIGEPMQIATEELPLAPNCDTVDIGATYSIDKSCNERATGIIVIQANEMAGGIPPYKYSINNAKDFYPNPKFKELYPGQYNIWIMDANGCMTQIGREYIEGVDCNYESVFAPMEGERWEVPSLDKAATLEIFNQQGVLVYEQRIEEGDKHHWEGTSQEGGSLKMGVYVFILKYDDNTMLNGNVTIVR